MIRTRIACKKVPSKNFIEFGMPSKQSTTHNKQKENRYISRYQTTNLLEIGFLFLNSAKRQKSYKSQESKFITKITGIIVKIFSYFNFSESASKIFARQFFFTDHMKHKTANNLQNTLNKYSPTMFILVGELISSQCEYFL